MIQIVIFAGLWMTLLTPSSHAAADGLENALDAMVGTLGNVTPPGGEMGQRRGVFSGGSAVIRNPITRSQPLNFSPPSLASGCGGIDLYGGSFSFINQSQFTALLRAIAANAGGYAFQLGINAMCPDCGSLMSDLQRKMQSLNEHFANSCQLAQGLVQDGLSALNNQNQSNISNLAITQGLTDVFEGWTSTTGDPMERLKKGGSQLLNDAVGGNIGWQFIQKIAKDQGYALGGDTFFEAVMSLTGSLIVSDPKSAPDGLGLTMPLTRLPPLIGLQELVEGSEQPENRLTSRVYRCHSTTENDCLHPVIEALDDQGLSGRIEALLKGKGPGEGIVGKFATGQGQFTGPELSFMARVPQPVGALIRNLAREDPGLSEHFAKNVARILALEMAFDLVESLLESVREASSLSDRPYASLYLKEIQGTLEARRSERERLAARYGTLSELIRHYESLEKSFQGRDYGGQAHLPGGSSVLKP